MKQRLLAFITHTSSSSYYPCPSSVSISVMVSILAFWTGGPSINTHTFNYFNGLRHRSLYDEVGIVSCVIFCIMCCILPREVIEITIVLCP